MSELPTGTVTVIHRCPGSARAGELRGKHPCAGSQDSPVVAAAGFGPIGHWQTRPRCPVCWMSSPSGSTGLPRRRITSRSAPGMHRCGAMRSGSGGCRQIRSARETCLRAGRNGLGRRMRSPWARLVARAAPLCVRQLLPPPLSGPRRVKSIACGDTGRPEQDDRRAATCATGTVVSRSYSAICAVA